MSWRQTTDLASYRFHAAWLGLAVCWLMPAAGLLVGMELVAAACLGLLPAAEAAVCCCVGALLLVFAGCLSHLLGEAAYEWSFSTRLPNLTEGERFLADACLANGGGVLATFLSFFLVVLVPVQLGVSLEWVSLSGFLAALPTLVGWWLAECWWDVRLRQAKPSLRPVRGEPLQSEESIRRAAAARRWRN